MKKAFITGITGQDGYHLTKLLIEKGYAVHGLIRRKSSIDYGHLTKIDKWEEHVTLHVGDLTDANSLNDIIRHNKFDEIYHLAAQSFVKESFNNPDYTLQVNLIGTQNLLSAVKMFQADTKVYNAGTSEMYGNVKMPETGYSIDTEMIPASPYGVAKLGAFDLCRIYRKSYNMFICTGVLFNHESPERGDEFVTQKIIKGMVRAFTEENPEPLVLGNLDACRDWGFAGDYVRAMWLMLQQDKPDDYVVATGLTHSVKDFCEMVLANLNKRFILEKRLELGDIVVINDDHKRPLEVDRLLGDATATAIKLGWRPEVSLAGLIDLMIEAQLSK